MTLPKKILVGTDFSEASDRALDYAIELAAAIGATVTVLHSYEIPVVGFPDGAFIATADVATHVADASQKGLDVTVATRTGRGVELTKILRQDAPWDAINAVAHEIGADMIVIGTHGRRGLAHALLGSIAEKIIRTSEIPVLTVRGPRNRR